MRVIHGVKPLIGGFIVLLIGGCATKPTVDWEGRIGTYTFDQAVIELGPPDRSTELTDGSKVAEWGQRRDSNVSFGIGTGYYGRGSSMGVGTSVYPGQTERYLRLTFARDGLLMAWKTGYR